MSGLQLVSQEGNGLNIFNIYYIPINGKRKTYLCIQTTLTFIPNGLEPKGHPV